MAYQWRMFWVGDVGDPVGGRPVPGWEDLKERERALGLRERQPILVAPDGRGDPRLSECLRRSAFSAKAQGTQVTYAPLYRLFFTFLWQRGLDGDEASEDDVEDWEDWRRRGQANPAPVEGGTWGKEQAALKLLYGIAAQRGLVPANPVTLASPSDVKTSDVKWLSPRAFRLWRNVGLGGMLPGGLEDEARRGRPVGRDTAVADLMYSSGLRRREGGTLLLCELPVLGRRNYYAGRVGQGVAKRAGYTFTSAIRRSSTSRAT